MVNTNYDNHQRYNWNISTPQIMNIVKFVVGGIMIVILLSIILNTFMFTVSETEQVIVEQFGEVVKIIIDHKTPEIVEQTQKNSKLKDVEIIEGKGLYFKIPFIQSIESFPNRLLTYDTNPREVITNDKKKLVLDNYAQWRIKNPALFKISLKNEMEAHKRLDDLIYSKLNEEIGKVDAHIVISDKDYVFRMLEGITERTNQLLSEYGVEVVDIRIKRTDLPPENYSNIYNRMKTEREREANRYRSEGKEEAQKIRSNAEKEAVILEAQAYEQAEKIKGEGDAEALRIYAQAYNKDPEFYAFWRTLQAYKKTLKDGTKIVIDADSEFAKYLFGSEQQ